MMFGIGDTSSPSFPLSWFYCNLFIAAHTRQHGVTYHAFNHTFTEDELRMDNYESLITTDLIRKRFITTDFCSMAYHYAPVVSATKKSIQRRLEIESEQDEDAVAASIFQVIHPSDIAWAVTTIVNNNDTWVQSFNQEVAEADKKRKEREAEVIAQLQAEALLGGPNGKRGRRAVKEQVIIMNRLSCLKMQIALLRVKNLPHKRGVAMIPPPKPPSYGTCPQKGACIIIVASTRAGGSSIGCSSRL